MVSSLKCECCNRYETEINSVKTFNEIKLFFDEQAKNGVYSEERVLCPYYVWVDDKEQAEHYATKWYRCMVCGCLWEFKYPDFPANGFVKKYENGTYTGTVVIKNNEESKKANTVLKSKRNNNVYYMFSDEIFVHGDSNKSINIPFDSNIVCFYDMYYVHDELFVVAATNKGYDYIYVLDEERMMLQKRGITH